MKLSLIIGASAVVAVYLFAGSVQAADVDKLVEVCADCHGKAGASTESDVPIIGGNSTEFLVNNLTAFQTRDRNCSETKFRNGSKKGEKTDMCKIVKDLSKEEIEAVADYFSKQKFIRAKQTFDAALAKKGKKLHLKYCEKCHSEGGTLSEDETGLPAGQWIPYLRHTLKEFKNGDRPIQKKMRARLNKIHGDDFDALVNRQTADFSGAGARGIGGVQAIDIEA